MPAKHHIDHEAKLITTTWVGEATDSSLIEALKTYQEDIQNDPKYRSYGEIVDFRNTPVFSISIKGLKSIGKTASQTDQYRAKTRLAFIVSTNLALSLVKLYALYRNFGKHNKKHIRAFKNDSDAHEWVRSDT